MSRTPKQSDFTVPVEGIGAFTFGRRTMRDEVSCQVEYARYLDGVEPTAWLQSVCGWLATLKVMTVRAPESWDLETLDPHDDEVYAKLKRVYDALREKELSFRRGPQPGSEASGA